MKNLKEIFNTPEEVTDLHNIIFLLFLVFGLFVFVLIGSDKIYWQNYLIPAIFTIYFWLIKTSFGKKKFNYINKIMYYGAQVGAIVAILNFIYEASALSSFYDFLQIFIMLIAFLFFLYWIVVFNAKKETNRRIFLTEKSNKNFFNILLVSEIGINILNYIVVIVEFKLPNYYGINIINSLIVIILFILRLRYIYLYQEHIAKRRNYYV